jgi:hypothetical protein
MMSGHLPGWKNDVIKNFRMAAGGGDVLGKPSWLAIV